MSLWLPLESDPDIFHMYTTSLGICCGMKFREVFDLKSLDQDFADTNVLGFMFLGPAEKYELSDDLDDQAELPPPPKDVTFIQQYVDNSCGTIALLNIIMNIKEKLKIHPGSILSDFIENAKEMTQKQLSLSATSKDMKCLHKIFSRRGSSQVSDVLDVKHHYTSFVLKGGHIYELNGRFPGPVDHGTSSMKQFCKKFVEICGKKMSCHPNDSLYHITAIYGEK